MEKEIMAEENTAENDTESTSVYLTAESEEKVTTDKDRATNINSNDESIKEVKMPTKVNWNGAIRYTYEVILGIFFKLCRCIANLELLCSVSINFADCCSTITSINEGERISRERITSARS
jgi:hypothetical protein